MKENGASLDFNRKDFKEEDLYRPIADFLENLGYEVRGENKYCDLTAMKGEELIVVELKKGLTIDLLLQGTKRQKIADLVYIAIPKPKKFKIDSRFKDIIHLLKRLELGLIMVNYTSGRAIVEVPLDPKLFNRELSIIRNKNTREKLIKEFKGRTIDLNVGGSKGKKLMTSYREDSLYIACCINAMGESSPKRILKLGSNEKKTPDILQKNYYNWFYRAGRGIYCLSEQGKEAIIEYKILTDIYNKKIQEMLIEKSN